MKPLENPRVTLQYKNSYQDSWKRTDLTSKIHNNAYNPIKICEEEPKLKQKFTIRPESCILYSERTSGQYYSLPVEQNFLAEPALIIGINISCI